MSEIYDNWERLVAATIKKQQLWELFHSHSRTPSILSEASSSDVMSSVISFNSEFSPIDVGEAVNSGLMQWASSTSDVTPLYEDLLDHRVLLRDNSSASGINAALRYKNTTAFIKSEVTAAAPPYVEYSSPLSDDYLDAVDEIIHITEGLKLHLTDDEAKDRADNELQQAMIRLEEAFRCILTRNTIPMDPDDSLAELIHPDGVVDLRDIADRMTRSGYEKELRRVYCSIRSHSLVEYLVNILGRKKLSKFQGWNLDDKMRKWSETVNPVIRGILSGEKHLCEQVFADNLITEVCFMEIARGCVMKLLNLGEVIASDEMIRSSPSPPSSVTLFRILDMYQALAQILPELKCLFMDNTDEQAEDNINTQVCSEAKRVLNGFGTTAIDLFLEFDINAVVIDEEGKSKSRNKNDGIHLLTRYVMDYINLIAVEYSDTLNTLLLENHHSVDPMPENKYYDDNSEEGETTYLTARPLLSLLCSLESKLKEMSRILYEKDSAMQYVFLMNNGLYVVQKVKHLTVVNHSFSVNFNQWIKNQRNLIRVYSIYYLRASWTKTLSCLADDGMYKQNSNYEINMIVLKERLKHFNACFEDNYRIQTAWKVPDPMLREELRFSIMERLIPAYRTFLGRFANHILSRRDARKCVKYAPEDLEYHSSDLFEGTPLILHRGRRISTTRPGLSTRLLSLFNQG